MAGPHQPLTHADRRRVASNVFTRDPPFGELEIVGPSLRPLESGADWRDVLDDGEEPVGVWIGNGCSRIVLTTL